MKKILPLLIALALLLSACEKPSADENVDASHTQPQESSGILPGSVAGSPSPDNTEPTPDDGGMFTDQDGRTGYDGDSILINLNGDSAVSSSDTVHINGSTVILSGEGTYILSGTLNDGMVVVDAGKKDKLQLVLNGVSIHSETSAALYIRQADKVLLTLAEGSENTLSNGGSFVAVDENNIDGALFSKDDLTLSGSGRLTVTSPAGHGVVAKDDLEFTGGSYTVVAASHGLDVNDSVRFTDATLTVTAGKDGIHVENNDDASLGFAYISGGTLSLQAAGDGVSTGAYLQIEGGDFHIVTGGGSGSSKGLKAAGQLFISGGTFVIDSADDAVHSKSDMVISGGSFEIATGDDGFHADELQTFSALEQGVIALWTGDQAAGTQIALTDASGNTLLSHASEIPFAAVILSCPDMVKGETYTVTVGASSGDFTAG